MKIPHRRVILILLFILFGSTHCYAQWKKIAPNLLAPLFSKNSYGGAFCFNSGYLWSGKNYLFVSFNHGITWQDRTPRNMRGVIISIDFISRWDGIITTHNAEVFLTNDGGLTWSDISISSASPYKGFFMGSTSTICLCTDRGLRESIDGGTTFAPTSIRGPSVDGKYIGNGMAYAVGDDVNLPLKSLFVTYDYGVTWRQTTPLAAVDCWQIDYDKCDTSTVYVVNEAAVTTNDGFCHLYSTFNQGKSWNLALSGKVDIRKNTTFLSGAVTTAERATYAQTNSMGVLRTTDHGYSWKSIGGPNMGFDTRFCIAISNNEVFAIDSIGSLWSTTNSGGDSLLDLPLDTTVRVIPSSLFDSDTLRCKDSIRQGIAIFRMGCKSPTLLSWKIQGVDSVNYSSFRSFYDSIFVTFAPTNTRLGNYTGVLSLLLSDSSTIKIPLKGFNDNQPFSLSYLPDTLFTRDTLTPCAQPLTQKIVVHLAGCLPAIIRDSITGPNSTNYQIISHIHSPLQVNDTIEIKMIYGQAGSGGANYELGFDNGRKIIVPLEGVLKPTPFTLSVSEDSLFQHDSLYSCDSGLVKSVNIHVGGCPIPKIVSQSLSGGSSGDYSILHKLADSVQIEDSLIIAFKPSTTGARNATFTATFIDGTQISLPLRGYEFATSQLTLGSTDQKMDTIGGEIDVPINMSGLVTDEQIELTLHYDTLLQYLGTFETSPPFAKRDIFGSDFPGRSKLSFVNANSKRPIAISRFLVYGDSSKQLSVYVDSLKFYSSVQPCKYFLPQRATSTIIPPSDCGYRVISRYMKGESLEMLRIIPNPVNQNANIYSSENLGESLIEIFDVLGSRVIIATVQLKKSVPSSLPIPKESGIYSIRIRTPNRIYTEHIMVQR
ncbi:MAG: T9SS type A sorting domain-containing protein [bacterium]